MASRKKDQKDQNSSIVTLIDDPFGIKTGEVLEAQNDPEELDFDENLSLNGTETETDTDGDSDHQSDSLGDFLELENSVSSEPEDEESDIPTSSESLEDQMAKLAQAIAHQTEADASELIDTLQTPPDSPQESEDEIDVSLSHLLGGPLELEQDPDQLPDQLGEQPAPEGIENQLTLLPEVSLDLAEVQSCIEAILFMSDKPLAADKLRTMLGAEFAISLFEDALSALSDRYQSSHHGIELTQVAGGYQFRTKPGRAHLSQKLAKTVTQRLSSGCMETLAIIAYKQPAMKEEVDKIRGVDSSHFIRGLMDKKLIQISGRSELPGRPMLYNTTNEFLEIFGIKDLQSLPSLRELEQMIPQSQSANPEDDDPRVRDMRRLVGEMKADKSSALYYNPKEDDIILKEIKDQVSAIPTSTPYLDQLKQDEHRIQEEIQGEHDKVPPQS